MPVVLLVVAYFALLATYDTVGFAREARSSSGVTRRRMQFVALGSLALAAAVLTSALATLDAARGEGWTVVGRLLALGSGVAYYLGFSPPIWLRRVWQAPALEALLAEIPGAAVPAWPANAAHPIGGTYHSGHWRSNGRDRPLVGV